MQATQNIMDTSKLIKNFTGDEDQSENQFKININKINFLVQAPFIENDQPKYLVLA